MERLHDLGVHSNPRNIEDAEYADDACLIAECLIRIMELLEVMAEESGKLGLKINFNKTKIMPISKEVNSVALGLMPGLTIPESP